MKHIQINRQARTLWDLSIGLDISQVSGGQGLLRNGMWAKLNDLIYTPMADMFQDPLLVKLEERLENEA